MQQNSAEKLTRIDSLPYFEIRRIVNSRVQPMVRRLLSLVLAATIVACPFCCMVGSATAKAAGEKHRPCCECCHDDRPPAPEQKSDEPGDCPTKSGTACQCICGGAVSDAGIPPDVGVDRSVWADLPADGLAALSVAEANLCITTAQLQPDDGHNLGRIMRCLFSTYLC
jgi:hypothetical protein